MRKHFEKPRLHVADIHPADFDDFRAERLFVFGCGANDAQIAAEPIEAYRVEFERLRQVNVCMRITDHCCDLQHPDNDLMVFKRGDRRIEFGNGPLELFS